MHYRCLAFTCDLHSRLLYKCTTDFSIFIHLSHSLVFLMLDQAVVKKLIARHHQGLTSENCRAPIFSRLFQLGMALANGQCERDCVGTTAIGLGCLDLCHALHHPSARDL
jgi:hypothetical protein